MGLNRAEQIDRESLKCFLRDCNSWLDQEAVDAIEFAVQAIEELDTARDTIDGLKDRVAELEGQVVS